MQKPLFNCFNHLFINLWRWMNLLCFTTKLILGSVLERHSHKSCSTESLARNLFFIIHVVEKPWSNNKLMKRAKNFSQIFFTPINMTLPLTTKNSAGTRIQRYLCLLNHLKNTTNSSCKTVWKKSGIIPKGIANQLIIKIVLNRGNNFPIDHVITAIGFAPTC